MTMSDDPIDVSATPSGTGCADCEANGTWWFHLRRCAKCGHIGCCDSSPAQHGSAHAASTGHPIVQSFEPGEDWFWDYASRDYYDGPQLAAPDSHPAGQQIPGPPERVPADWQSQLR